MGTEPAVGTFGTVGFLDAMIDSIDGWARGTMTRAKVDMRGKTISRLEASTFRFRSSLRGYAPDDVERFRANAKAALGEAEGGASEVSMSGMPEFRDVWFGYSRVGVDEFVGRVWATLGPTPPSA